MTPGAKAKGSCEQSQDEVRGDAEVQRLNPYFGARSCPDAPNGVRGEPLELGSDPKPR